MMGDSAGGHFAIILTLAMNNKGYAKQLGYSFTRRAELLVLNCSVYDFENLGKGMITKKAQKRLFGPNYQDSEARKLISPKQHIALLDVPLFTSSCTKDFIRSETTSLISDLEKLNKPHTFIDIKEKNVGHVHNVWNPYSKLSMYVNEEMVKFINKFLS